ncbi:MAG: HIT domain-containing protein [Verrucomicrobiia bacterium]
MKTIFQKIIDRELPAEVVAETEQWIAFRDIHPAAPTHLLVVPKKVIPRLGAAEDGDGALLGELLLAARRVAREHGLDSTGFRIVINHGADGGETVPHLHLHVIGGRPLRWPPG